MAFWLARERNGQETDYIQRFDPRFWTVNFPRPAMASVISVGADGLRVDCDFYHEGELVGLIWDSDDTLDHPLLAYETRRDYSRSTLRFRWTSSNLMALDAVNGPTLTIEGRDVSGTPRSWFVRLWNYAEGSPTDAEIVLPFSSLGSGWSLPGEAVYPADIDRMFISLVSQEFVAGSDARFPAAKSAWLTLTNISCDGERSVLEIGDVIVPPHDTRIATAYDDSYNQNPERIVRLISHLGYRDEIVHYVGMSHFPRLGDDGSGRLTATRNEPICAPAMNWHRQFFRACRSSGLEVIASISYELLADYCPDSWQQRAADGEAGRTGWDPPSALLSPAHAEAMAWLQASARDFALVLQAENLPVRVQIGEPWWWITAAGKPCLYDGAAVEYFGGQPPVITDMKAVRDPEELELLDTAGQLLAQSTADLASSVRAVSENGAEILLLAFTPTILSDEMPELYRANLPVGWAYPAFDRLQLEDYDWLGTGDDARRRAAYALIDQRLGYPIDRQDYMAGFVLDPADADAVWPRIDSGLDEAAARGISNRFVWAMPQVARDGYVRLPAAEEEDMQAFDDILYPLALGRDTAISPEFSTSIAVTSSGHERRNSLWTDARLHFDVGPGVRSEHELGTLIGFFRARRGAAKGFRIGDPFDFSSNGMTGTPTPFDQIIGTGDGMRADFSLVKAYGSGDDPQTRPITRPRAETVRVSIAGLEVKGWELIEGGKLRFAEAPAANAEIRCGYLFDVPVRFAQDRLDVSGVNFAAGEAPSVPLVEIREAV